MNSARTWDIYETGTLVVRKSMTAEWIREALSSGKITETDLIRPSGTSEAWQRISEFPLESLSTPVGIAGRPESHGAGVDQDLLDPDAEIDLDPDSGANEAPVPQKAAAKDERSSAPREALPSIELQALQWLTEEDPEPVKPVESQPEQVVAKPAKVRKVERETPLLEPSVELKLEPAESSEPRLSFDESEDEEDDFTLSRSKVEHVEEMDLAAMVDIAFQLVLFFMVTASVTMIKSMELPKPTESTKPAAATAPGVGTRDRNELADEFIVVKITSDGDILVDDEPIPSDRLLESLRAVRNESGKTGMLLRAENRTKHRLAVAAYDAASEIGLRIAIERETSGP
ncbi:hypothetical protein GC170_10480 [bacterium]|nr:hypothetical protein [bacterium]